MPFLVARPANLHGRPHVGAIPEHFTRRKVVNLYRPDSAADLTRRRFSIKPRLPRRKRVDVKERCRPPSAGGVCQPVVAHTPERHPPPRGPGHALKLHASAWAALQARAVCGDPLHAAPDPSRGPLTNTGASSRRITSVSVSPGASRRASISGMSSAGTRTGLDGGEGLRDMLIPYRGATQASSDRPYFAIWGAPPNSPICPAARALGSSPRIWASTGPM